MDHDVHQRLLREGESALDPSEVSLPPGHRWNRFVTLGLVAGAVGIAASVLLGVANPRQFFFSWLVAFLFFLSLGLGALYFVLIHHAVQAGWSVVVRRIAENVMATLPVLAVLFLPVVFGMHQLYHWSEPGAAEHDALLRWKEPYLNETFFLVRAAVYFAAWSLLAAWYGRLSVAQDRERDHDASRRQRRWAGPALIALGLTQTFASFDWVLSLTPHWYSTIFGVYFFSGALVAVFAFLALVLIAMRRAGLLTDVVTVEHFHDLGKLLFAFTVFWAYIAFSQYFLIWYANIPEETVWFRDRLAGSWGAVSTFLAVGHFALPFFFLLPRAMKRRTGTLLAGAVWMLAMHALDLYWLVMPTLHPEGVRVSPLDVTSALGIGGIFAAAFFWFLRRRALVPVGDPRLRESLAFENL